MWNLIEFGLQNKTDSPEQIFRRLSFSPRGRRLWFQSHVVFYMYCVSMTSHMLQSVFCHMHALQLDSAPSTCVLLNDTLKADMRNSHFSSLRVGNYGGK